MSIPWTERINAISVNPAMATLKDIAKMAAELIDYKTKPIKCPECGSKIENLQRLEKHA